MKRKNRHRFNAAQLKDIKYYFLCSSLYVIFKGAFRVFCMCMRSQLISSLSSIADDNAGFANMKLQHVYYSCNEGLQDISSGLEMAVKGAGIGPPTLRFDMLDLPLLIFYVSCMLHSSSHFFFLNSILNLQWLSKTTVSSPLFSCSLHLPSRTFPLKPFHPCSRIDLWIRGLTPLNNFLIH